MKKLVLTRFAYHNFGTYGKLSMPSGIDLATVEPAWRGNEENKSCIPIGFYLCERGYHNRGKYETFEVSGVPNRTLIKFDIANWPKDLLGCIGLGDRHALDESDGSIMVKNSKVTHNRFMRELNGVDAFHLSIVNYRGGI